MAFDCTRRRLGTALLGYCGALALLGPVTVQARVAANDARILVLGDSLSAEYGIARGSGWVALLDRRLKDSKLAATVINGSISGETTAGGRTRLPGLLQTHRPTLVLIELGGNDALRGWSLRTTEDNLTAMVEMVKAAGARPVLVGMQLPPNYGRRYAEDFARLYRQVAERTGSPLVPFLLSGVADRADARDWFQGDGIHPAARAHPVMLDNVWAVLRPLLGR